LGSRHQQARIRTITEETIMSNAETITATSVDPTVAAARQFLTPVVLGLQALTLNGKQAHWHVRGANFVGVHELLDVIVDHAGDFADTAAEPHRRPGAADRRPRRGRRREGQATQVPCGFTPRTTSSAP
jgi:starvation-inducible DNA-binding protein